MVAVILVLLLFLFTVMVLTAGFLSVLRWRERLDGTDADWLDWPREDWR